MVSIAVFTEFSDLISSAQQLAHSLQLSYSNQADYLLLLTPERLSLQKTGDKSLPLSVDFLSGKMNYRREHLSLRKEALARALGLKKQIQPTIVDATAGLARDSFIIASLGFSVQMIERSPIIYALVNDGMQRASTHPDTAAIMQRMQLIQANAVEYLTTLTPPDIIYLDPMFPERKKSALTKIDMRIFHDIVGDDLDADLLLKTALSCAKERVVVKRPRYAPELAHAKPSFSLVGTSSRFDIYLV